MKEIKSYLSENEQFVFETKEECEYYNSFGLIEFNNPFLEVEGIKFSLLEIEIDEKTQVIQAFLQSLNSYVSELSCSNHDDLWKVVYDFNKKTGAFKKKSGIYDRFYGDIDFESANAEGWFPFWENVHIDYYTTQPEEFSKETFILWMRTCFINYFTAFGCIERLRQAEIEDSVNIGALYGFLAVKMSKYKRRIDELEKKKEGLKEIHDKKEYSLAFEEIDSLLERNQGFVRFIEEIEYYL